MNTPNIADNIKRQRIKSKLTQQDLADKMYVTRQTISNYETGKSCPDIESLEQISHIFNVEIETLLYGDTHENKRLMQKKTIIKIAVILVIVILLFFYERFAMQKVHITYIVPLIFWINRYITYPAALILLLRQAWILISTFFDKADLITERINQKRWLIGIITAIFAGYFFLASLFIINLMYVRMD